MASFRLLVVSMTLGASAASADEFLGRIQKPDGTWCQQIQRGDEVLESCRAGEAFHPPNGAASLTDGLGARRGATEALAAVGGAFLWSALLLATCSLCSATTVALVYPVQLITTGAFGSLAHGLLDGQAGFGWGILGALVGGSVGILVNLILAALGVAPLLVIAVSALLGVLPSIGAVVALEIRDTSLRRSAVGLPPAVSSLELGRF